MNKKFIFVIFLIIFSHSVFANSEIKVERQDYSSFETLQAGIKFQYPLSKNLDISNIKLMNNNFNIQVSKRLIKLNSQEYYIYFDLPQINPGIYDFGVYDYFYNENETTKKGSNSIKINIINNTENLISINPGFVLAKTNDYDEVPFTLLIKNNGNNNVDININTEGNFLSIQQNKFLLTKKSSKNININTVLYNKEASNFSGKVIVNYNSNSYLIPVFINRLSTKIKPEPNLTVIANNTKSDNNVEIKDYLVIADLYGNPLDKNYTINPKNEKFELSLVNNGDLILSDVSLELTGNIKDVIKLSKVSFDYFPAYGIIPLDGELEDINGNYSGYLSVKSKESKEFVLPIFLYSDAEIVVKEDNKTIIINQSSNNLVIVKEEKNPFILWIVILIILLIIVLLIFYLRRKSKPKQDEFERFMDSVKSRR